MVVLDFAVSIYEVFSLVNTTKRISDPILEKIGFYLRRIIFRSREARGQDQGGHLFFPCIEVGNIREGGLTPLSPPRVLR